MYLTRWIAKMVDGNTIIEGEGITWNELNTRNIHQLGIRIGDGEGILDIYINRETFLQTSRPALTFGDFIQFRTALLGKIGEKMGDNLECHAIGVGDNQQEFVIKIRPELTKRIHYHPFDDSAPDNVKALRGDVDEDTINTG